MGELIEESPQLRGIPPSDTAREIVARARSSTGLGDEEAMAIVVREIGLHRARRGD